MSLGRFFGRRAANEAERAQAQADAEARAKRLEEIEELKAKLTAAPPQQLSAAIKIYEKTFDELELDVTPATMKDINAGVKPHAVDLYLVPSEEERAIILKYKLDQLLIDDESFYSDEELVQHEQHIGKNPYARNREQQESLAELERRAFEEARHTRHYTKLGDLFNFPHQRCFRTPHDAHTYSVKLRSELLPKVRGFIDDYKSRGDTETFTV